MHELHPTNPKPNPIYIKKKKNLKQRKNQQLNLLWYDIKKEKEEVCAG